MKTPCLCGQLWTYLKPSPTVSVVDFEQINVCWVTSNDMKNHF